jgi:hypothetical protein
MKEIHSDAGVLAKDRDAGFTSKEKSVHFCSALQMCASQIFPGVSPIYDLRFTIYQSE